MKNKKLEIASLLVMFLYIILCVVDIVCCLVYRFNFESSFSYNLAYFVRDFTFFLFFVPALPTGVVLSICAAFKEKPLSKPRKYWIIWTAVSPIIYIVFYCAVVVVFVFSTGGV